MGLEQGANTNAALECDTRLSRFAIMAKVDLVKKMLSSGADFRRGDVLHYAAEREDTACVAIRSGGACQSSTDKTAAETQWTAPWPQT